MKQDLSSTPMTRAEQEVDNEGSRLIETIESALATVAIRSSDEAESLEQYADRIDRAARDLSFAIRELAQERRNSQANRANN